MKTYLFAAVLAIALTGCTRSDRSEVKTESEQMRARTENTADAANAKRKDYQDKMEERLDRIDRQIDEEKAKAESEK